LRAAQRVVVDSPSPYRRGGSRTLLARDWIGATTLCRHPGGSSSTGSMNIVTTLEIKGDWNVTKGKLKQKWAKLTDDDLQYVEGKQEELLGRIQERTGENREAVEKAIKDYSSAHLV
jgi:uncharacterized protein YjbJ (UPF0337 family)